jgi:hypothetical protein
VIRDGAARLDLPAGYEVSARFIDMQPHGAARASVALLNGTVAVAVWGGSVAVISDGTTVVDSMGPGTMLEFSPGPQSSPGGKMAAPTGGGPTNAAVGTCSGALCVQGKVTIANGKVYIDDENLGARIELRGAIAGLKDGQRFSADGTIVKPANPKDNSGLVLNVTVTQADPTRVNVGKFQGKVTTEGGRYWLVDSKLGLKFELKPGSVGGIKTGQTFPVAGKVEPPKGGKYPTLEVNPSIEGTIEAEGDGNNRKLFITDPSTRVKTELKIDPNNQRLAALWDHKGPAQISGYVTNRADSDNNRLQIAVSSARKIEQVKESRPISVTGPITTSKGKYYIDDPVTGVHYEITPGDLKKELDKQADQQKKNKEKGVPPPPDITINGTVQPPSSILGETYPQIVNPKRVAKLTPVTPGDVGNEVIITTASVAAAVILTGVVVAEEGNNKPPASR